MIELDKPFYLLINSSIKDLLKLPYHRTILPITHRLEIPLTDIRSWGGRRVDKTNNPFTAALEGLNLEESLKLYENKIELIKKYYHLKKNVLHIDFFELFISMGQKIK